MIPLVKVSISFSPANLLPIDAPQLHLRHPWLRSELQSQYLSQHGQTRSCHLVYWPAGRRSPCSPTGPADLRSAPLVAAQGCLLAFVPSSATIFIEGGLWGGLSEKGQNSAWSLLANLSHELSKLVWVGLTSCWRGTCASCCCSCRCCRCAS